MLALVAVVLALQAPLTLADTMVSTTGPVRLRARPDTAAPVVARLPAKTLVYVTRCTRGWCRVETSTRAGYVQRRFLADEHVDASLKPATDADLWVVQRQPFGERHRATLSLPAVATVQGPVGVFRPTLEITCNGLELYAYVKTVSTLVFDSIWTSVRLRWGRGRAEAARWIISRDRSGAFPHETAGFVMRLQTDPDLQFEFRLFDGQPRTATFNARGLASHLSELRDACPCIKGVTWGSYCREPSDVMVEGEVDELPQLVYAPALGYPDSLQREGIGGEVLLEAILDTAGRVEPASIRVIASAHPGFDAFAREHLLAWLFTPARINGRAVRVLVRVPINFKIS